MPSAEAIIDRAFADLLGKARRRADDEFRKQQTKESTINLVFSSGSGIPLPSLGGLPGGVEVPYACIPTWCHIYAGDDQLVPVAVTATVELQVTTILAYGTTTPFNGTGLQPTLNNESAANISLEGWMPSLLAADIIQYRLNTFSGAATWLTVSIGLRALDSDQIVPVVDSTGDFVVDENGNTVILRG